MIRKQVYIEPRHERMLKRRARQRGVTEAEIIREALDRVETVAVVRRRQVDKAAARKALRFMRLLGASRRKAPEAVRGQGSHSTSIGSADGRSPDRPKHP